MPPALLLLLRASSIAYRTPPTVLICPLMPHLSWRVPHAVHCRAPAHGCRKLCAGSSGDGTGGVYRGGGRRAISLKARQPTPTSFSSPDTRWPYTRRRPTRLLPPHYAPDTRWPYTRSR